MRLFSIVLLVAAGLSYAGSRAYAETQVYQPTPLLIYYHSDISRVSGSKRAQLREQWVKACKSLKEAMLKGHSAFGAGAFSGAQCVIRKNLLAKDTKDLGKDFWVLDLSRVEKALAVEMSHHVQKGKSNVVLVEAQFSVDVKDEPLKLLGDPQRVAPIAAMIADKMPFSYAFKVSSENVTHSFVTPGPEAVPKLPKKLVVFGLTYDVERDLWIPEPVGTAEVVVTTDAGAKVEEPAAKDDGEDEGEGEGKAAAPVVAPGKTSTVTVTLKPQIKTKGHLNYDWYFAQDMRGRGFNSKEFERDYKAVAMQIKANAAAAAGEKVKAEEEDDAAGGDGKEQSLSQQLLNQIAAGYAGFRFGQSMAKGEPLLEDAQFLGMFVEIRSGILNGLRFNADLGLEKKIRQDDLDLSFKWRRYTLGWSFGREIDLFFTRIDIIPRIGVMDIRSTLPVPSPTDENKKIAINFNMVNAPDFGAEIGIEKQFSFTLLRLWAASDFAIGLLEKAGGGKGTITSVRGGVDTYFELFKLGKTMDLNLLLFGLGERISLTQKIPEDQQSTDVPTIEGLSYSFGFVGAGLTLSW